MIKGYLINGKTIAEYAKWYLSNPLRDRFRLANTSDPVLAKDTYGPKDVAKVKALFRKAKAHPDMLAFAYEMATSLSNDSNVDIGFNLGSYHHFKDRQGLTSVENYTKWLKKQSVMSYSEIITKAKSINQTLKARNRKNAEYNKPFRACIINQVKAYPKNIHYKKFTKGRAPFDDIKKLADKESTSFEDCLKTTCLDSNDEHTTDTALSRFTDDRTTGKVGFDTSPVNIYGTIAFWNAQMKPVKRLIDVKKIPKQSAFKRDVDYHNLLTGNHLEWNGFTYDQFPNLSDQKRIVDYQNIVEHSTANV